MEELHRQFEVLGHIQKEVEEQVNRAVKAGKEIDQQVNKWLEEVYKINTNMKTNWLVDEKAKSTRMDRLFCHSSQSKVSNKDALIKLKTLVNGFVAEGKSILCVCFPGDSIGIELVWREGFVEFKSRRLLFHRILEGLKSEEVGLIGIFGMGGIGKTKLVVELGMKAKNEKLFDQVVIVTVSQNPDIRNIQGTFADMLNLKFGKHTHTETDRANELRARIEKESRILVILDDVWKQINIDRIGVPLPTNHNGCKIVLTTRGEKVCEDMGCSLLVRLDVIEEDEAWRLFSKYAELQHRPILNSKAKRIVRECAGLPLAIITVGSALRNRSLEDFEDAARRLSKSSFVDIESVDGVDVYACLKLSYDFLEDEEAQKCFLLCSLFPEDSEIKVEDLVRYAYGLWLSRKVESVDKARQMILASVCKLENACLLFQKQHLDPDFFLQKRCVKMHDIVRDVALWIANKEYGLFLVATSLNELQTMKINEKAFAISVSSRDFRAGLLDLGEQLSSRLEGVCALGPLAQIPATLTFLRMHITSTKWPGNFFFRKTSILQVLDMDIVIPRYWRGEYKFEVPISLEHLANLRILRITGQDWRNSDMSIVGRLKNLEILQLDRGPEVLPEWIGELCNLRMLDLSSWLRLEEIPCNLLSRLTKLEELYSSSYRMERAEYVSDLTTLPRLTVFTGWFNMQAESFRGDFSLEMLKRYCISYTDDLGFWSTGWSKILGLYCRDELSMKVFEHFLQGVECLWTTGPMHGIYNLCPQLEKAGFQKLRELLIGYSENIECLIDTTGTRRGLPSLTAVNVFPNLVELSLHSMPQLGKMCHGPPPFSFLEQLRSVRIDYCPMIKNIVPDILPVGPLLEELHIRGCDALEYVYEVEAEALRHTGFSSGLPSPNIIWLSHIKKMRSIWKGPYKLERKEPTNEEGEVKSSTKIAKAILRSLNSLVTLNIYWSDELEEVFPLVEFDNQEPVGQLSNLVELDFRELPNLKCIWQRTQQNYWLHSLERITLYQCDKLTSLFTSSLAKSLARLQELEIKHCKALETIIVRDDCCEVLQGTRDCFKEIKNIKIESCEKLKSVLPISFIAQGLPKLETFSIKNCANLEQVFKEGEEMVAERAEIELKNLQVLELVNLPRLARLLPYNWHLKMTSLSRLTMAMTKQEEYWKLPGEVLLGLKIVKIESSFHHAEEALFDIEEAQQPFLTRLETVEVRDMPGLKHLWKGHTQFIRLCNLYQLDVYNCASIKSVFSLSMARNLPNLSWLTVDNCPELEHIFHHVRSEQSESTDLEAVNTCENFEKIFEPCSEQDSVRLEGHSLQPHAWLPNLRSIHVRRCDSLRTLFPLSVTQHLPSLRAVEVKYAPQLERLFTEDREGYDIHDNNIIVLPQLKSMQLEQLYSLSSICPLTCILSYQSFVKGIEVTIENCKTHVDYNAQIGRFRSLVLPNIRTLCQLVNLSHLRHITVKNAVADSKSLFPHNIARALGSLEVLEVFNCKYFETLIEPSGDDIEELSDLETVAIAQDRGPFFPNLQSLRLTHLSNLACLWKGPTDLINLSHLKFILLAHCGMQKMKSLFTRTIAQSLYYLEEIRIFNCNELENLIEPACNLDNTQLHENYSATCFPRLMYLSLNRCDKLKTVFPLSIAQWLPELRGIYLMGLLELEEFFTDDRNEGNVGWNKLIKLPELLTLHLIELPCLSRMCPAGYALCCQAPPEDFCISGCPLMDTDKCFPSLYREQIERRAV